jgi:uncharacterized membrane protein YhaH (DUF805 family)
MDTTIVSAVVGGLFSLISVWLSHYLHNNNNKNTRRRSQSRASTQHLTDLDGGKKSRAFFWGITLLILDSVILVLVVKNWNFESLSWLQNLFIFFIVGAVPVFALYLIILGIYYQLRRFFNKGRLIWLMVIVSVVMMIWIVYNPSVLCRHADDLPSLLTQQLCTAMSESNSCIETKQHCQYYYDGQLIEQASCQMTHCQTASSEQMHWVFENGKTIDLIKQDGEIVVDGKPASFFAHNHKNCYGIGEDEREVVCYLDIEIMFAKYVGQWSIGDEVSGCQDTEIIHHVDIDYSQVKSELIIDFYQNQCILTLSNHDKSKLYCNATCMSYGKANSELFTLQQFDHDRVQIERNHHKIELFRCP